MCQVPVNRNKTKCRSARLLYGERRTAEVVTWNGDRLEVDPSQVEVILDDQVVPAIEANQRWVDVRQSANVTVRKTGVIHISVSLPEEP